MPDIQLKRGDPAAVNAYIGPSGEMVVDKRNWSLHLQDGTTAGGGTVLGSTELTVAAPEVISPLDGATGVDPHPIIQTSAFAGSGSHAASRFQISTDAAFTNLIHDSGRDEGSLLQYALAGEGITLQSNTAYYARARHESTTAGWSNWSPVNGFTVA